VATRGALEEFYDDAAARLAAHLDAGRDVVVLCEATRCFYGSFMHLHKRLAQRYPVEVCGVTSVAGAAANSADRWSRPRRSSPCCPHAVPDALARRLADTDSAAILKLGRTFTGVRDALAAAGRWTRPGT